MDRVGIRELKQNASAVAARVSAGESLIVTDRGRPVMRLIPYRPSTYEDMITAGLITPGSQDFSNLPEPDNVPGISLTDEILRARLEERY